jgi:hypothetical protein
MGVILAVLFRVLTVMFSVLKMGGLVICPLVYIVNIRSEAGANPLFVTLIVLFSDRSILIIAYLLRKNTR